jgi:hypothetical protein
MASGETIRRSYESWVFLGRCFNLVLCYVMLPHFMCKIWCSKRVKSYALLCCVMICYADLFYEQNSMLSMSKILWSVMLCLWWHELKSKILWYVMLVLFVSKILCSVMNLTTYWAFEYSDSISYPDQSGRNQMYQVPLEPEKLQLEVGPPWEVDPRGGPPFWP